MRSAHQGIRVFALVFALTAALQIGVLNAAQAEQSPATLSKEVAAFNVRGLCLVDALLTLGNQEQVPLGIEYVTREALEKPISDDFHNATVGQIVQVLLGRGRGYTWRVRDGVLNVSHRSVASGQANLLDRVLPKFAITKCTVQVASHGLYMDLYMHLHPETTGWAGDFNPGNPQNLIGPLELRNAPVRQILNRLVSANKKGAWIVRVQPGCLDQLPSGGLWTIIEYEAPPRRYAEDLRHDIFGWGLPPSSKKVE
jgi:hypothetical protein